MLGTIFLCVENTRTRIYGASPPVLQEIDSVTSYLQNDAMSGVDAKRYNLVDLDYAWDGYIRFLNRDEDPPSIPSGLRDIVHHHLLSKGIACTIQDYRFRPEEDIPRYPKAIPLWAHQGLCHKAMVSGGDCVARMPPRAGKTRTLLEVVRSLSLPTLWIAPTSSIVTQTIREGRKWFEEYDVTQVSSSNWEEHKNTFLTVTTSSGMLQLPPEFFQTRQHIVCDEVHHFLAHKAWGTHLLKNTEHVYHRKGMTGTFFRSGGDDLALLAFLGRVGFSCSSKELLDKGFLVPTYTCFLPIEGPSVKSTQMDFLGKGGHGQLGIATHSHRCDVVAAVARHLQALNRTVVILVATKQQGYLIKQRLDALLPSKGPGVEFDRVEFVSTDRPKPIIQKIYSSFTSHEEVQVLIGTSMVGEGIDLPPADALIYAAGGKAAVSYVQALYRVCTAHPGKQYGVVVDFIDKQHKKLLEHSRERWRVASSDPVFQMGMISGLNDFPGWASNTAVPSKGI